MTEKDRSFLESKLGVFYGQITSLAELLEEISDATGEDEHGRLQRVRITQLLTRLIHAANQTLEDFIEQLYNGDGEEILYNETAGLMRRYGRTVKAFSDKKGDTAEDKAVREILQARAAEDSWVMTSILGFGAVFFKDGTVNGFKGAKMYTLDIDDDDAELRILKRPQKRADEGGNNNEDNA